MNEPAFTPAGDWWTNTASPKAWMSVRDADLLEALVHRQANRRDSPLRVLEWGSGRSTLWYPRYLQQLGRSYLWVSVEHDHHYCESALMAQLPAGTRVSMLGSPAEASPQVERPTEGIWLYTFSGGFLRPYLPDHEADRAVNLDAYVELPRLLEESFDVVIVDGRKRCRCLGIAAKVVAEDGCVLLHDAWRTYYHQGMAQYASGRRFGDEWWVGARRVTDFSDLLPWHAFERHRDSSGLWLGSLTEGGDPT